MSLNFYFLQCPHQIIYTLYMSPQKQININILKEKMPVTAMITTVYQSENKNIISH